MHNSLIRSLQLRLLLRPIRSISFPIGRHQLRDHNTNRVFCRTCCEGFLYDRMASGERILVYLQDTEADGLVKADFAQCIVDQFKDGQSHELTTNVTVEVRDNKMLLGKPSKKDGGFKIKHPDFCPIFDLDKETEASLPEDIKGRGVDTGAAVILESGDGQILLTRRGDHLRTFPGIWVPPGGHLESNESLTEAGLRELEEETGLKITLDMCECQHSTLPVLAMWESVFPPRLAYGSPKRHHAVVYLHAKLNPELTSDVIMSKVKVDPGEVGACAFFDKNAVKAIVSVKETGDNAENQFVERLKDDQFKALIVNEHKEQVEGYLPFAPLFCVSGSQNQQGRVSTGTKFCLEEWLTFST